MRHSFLIIFFFIFSESHGQNHVRDSLRNFLKDYPKEDTIKVNTLNDLSYQYQYIDFHKSLNYAEQSLNLAKHLSFKKGLAMANYRKAYSYWALGYDELSIEKAMLAIEISKRESLPDILAESFRVLAMDYRDQQEIEKATFYIGQAEQLSLLTKNWDLLSRVYNTAGLLEFDKKKNDTCLVLFNRALQITEEYETSKFHICQIISNKGDCQLTNNNPDSALKYFSEALVRAKNVGNKQAEAGIMCDIGRALAKKKKYREADKYMQEGLQLSRKLDFKRVIRYAYLALIDLKVHEGKSAESFRYLKNYYDVRDSLLNAAKTRQIVELETRYETEKKDQAIQLLKRDKKIQQLWTNILIAVFILISVSSLVLYFLQRYHEKKNRQILNLEIDNLTTQQKELSEKYKNILTRGNEKSIESADQRLLKKAIEIVENNMSDPLFGVEKLAMEMGMSRSNLHRKIKVITGFPPNELIRSIRLRKAALLLLNQADSVAQISFKVGFEDHSYFSKSFKKQFGVSPSEYLQSRDSLSNQA